IETASATGSEKSSPASTLPPNSAASATAPPRRRGKANPFGTHEQKLSYAPRPGYYRRWFNDVGTRITQALEGGYTHVVGNDGKNVMRPVGVAEHGGALIAYLLEIPKEWYDEDMAAQQAEVDKVEEAMRRGVVPGGNTEGMYLPVRPDGMPRLQIVH